MVYIYLNMQRKTQYLHESKTILTTSALLPDYFRWNVAFAHDRMDKYSNNNNPVSVNEKNSFINDWKYLPRTHRRNWSTDVKTS